MYSNSAIQIKSMSFAHHQFLRCPISKENSHPGSGIDFFWKPYNCTKHNIITDVYNPEINDDDDDYYYYYY